MEYDSTINNGSVNITDCDGVYSTPVFKAVAIVRALSGSISSIASLLVILVILVFKKYLFFTQRLILYLSIASMLNGLSIAFQGATYYPANEHTERYCKLAAFFDQITLWSLLLATGSITLDIYFKVATRRENRWEVAYILSIFVLPVTFNWIPFVDNKYGLAGPWCWIKRTDSDCGVSTAGLVLRFILWYIPVYLVLFAIIIMYFVVYASIRKRRQYFGAFDPKKEQETKRMKKEIAPLIWYPFLFLLLQIPPTFNRVAELTTDQPIVELWFFHALFSPLQGGLICVAYALDPETRARLSRCSCRSTLTQCFSSDSIVEEYPAVKGYSDSATESQRAPYFQLGKINGAN